MSNINKLGLVGFCIIAALSVGACEAEVGSPEWCENMNEKPKGEWTVNEAGDFAKHCIL